MLRHVRLTYQPPASSTFLSEQISHQQPVNSTFLSEQTTTSHQLPAKRTSRWIDDVLLVKISAHFNPFVGSKLGLTKNF
jgi:hypothetical protein